MRRARLCRKDRFTSTKLLDVAKHEPAYALPSLRHARLASCRQSASGGGTKCGTADGDFLTNGRKLGIFLLEWWSRGGSNP